MLPLDWRYLRPSGDVVVETSGPGRVSKVEWVAFASFGIARGALRCEKQTRAPILQAILTLTARTRNTQDLPFRSTGRRCSLRRAIAVIALAGVTASVAVSVGWAGDERGTVPVIVSGTVVDGLRTPLTGVTIDLYYARGLSKPVRVGSATTDANGRFAVRTADRAAFHTYSSRSGGWLTIDLLAGHSSLTVHKVLRRKLVRGRWLGPPRRAGSTGLGVLVLAKGQPAVAATVPHSGSTEGPQGWIYGLVVREPGLDPRSGSGGEPTTVPVAGDPVVARDADGSTRTVSARDGSFQMRLPAGVFTVSEDICGVSRPVTIQGGGAADVRLEIPNAC
jgi:hypothetical protein